MMCTLITDRESLSVRGGREIGTERERELERERERDRAGIQLKNRQKPITIYLLLVRQSVNLSTFNFLQLRRRGPRFWSSASCHS